MVSATLLFVISSAEPPLQKVNDDVRWGIIKQKANEENVRRAFHLFRQHEIEPILIKGVAVARYYPSDELRDSVDIDLAVSSADYLKADALIRSPEAVGLAIDLHNELRHLDTLAWNELVKNSETFALGDSRIRVLSPEDHLRVICVHWLTDGGANRERLRDIYYMVANREANFDWDRCLNVVDKKRRRYVTCVLGAAGLFMDLDLTGTPAEGAASKMPPWMVRSIEAEWNSPTPFRPLFVETKSLGQFFSQLRKRFPPNPITATILRGGSLDARTRIFYQLGTILDRAIPSIKNLAASIFPTRQ